MVKTTNMLDVFYCIGYTIYIQKQIKLHKVKNNWVKMVMLMAISHEC